MPYTSLCSIKNLVKYYGEDVQIQIVTISSLLTEAHLEESIVQTLDVVMLVDKLVTDKTISKTQKYLVLEKQLMHAF